MWELEPPDFAGLGLESGERYEGREAGWGDLRGVTEWSEASDVGAEPVSLERPEEVTSEDSLAAAMAEVKAGSR